MPEKDIDVKAWAWVGENKLSYDVWDKKYRNNGESFDEWIDRVSGGNEDIAELIRQHKFLFGGRILAGRGLAKNGRKLCSSNCFVVTPPEDNIESIFDCAKKMARTYSRGGGCGTDLGKLAPRGAKIRNAANETSGAVSFMDLYSMVTGLIGMSGRRGALMLSMPVNHPDIEEFIGVKTDLNRVTKANISVRVDDEFMRAVENDGDYTLSFTREETGETISRTVRARDLFHKIAETNYDYAEPGMLFWDTIENNSYLSAYPDFHYAGTNPCFTGDMQLLTADGYKRFEDICDTEPDIINANGKITKGSVWSTGKKEVCELVLENGMTIKCTPNHVFMLNDGGECEARDLLGKRLHPYITSAYAQDPTFLKLGYIQACGRLDELNDPFSHSIHMDIGSDEFIREDFASDRYTEDDDGIFLFGYNDLVHDMGFTLDTPPYRTFPAAYADWDNTQKAAFLCGLFTANGSVRGKRILLRTECPQVADILMDSLRADFGLTPHLRAWHGHWWIVIRRYQDILTFCRNISFHGKKLRKVMELLLKNAPRVAQIHYLGRETVYDFSEPETHWGVVNGLIVHNCGEEPLPSGGACLLSSINLSEYVTDPFTDKAAFDFGTFDIDVRKVVYAMDDVLSEGMPLLPLDEQKESALAWRQIGIGIMGLGDMLIKLGVRYGSSQAVSISERIAMAMANQAAVSSALLAYDRGPYRNFDMYALIQSPMYNKLNDSTKHIIKDCGGMRHSQILTCAPTGSISMIMGQVSSGIEPIFANSYTRKTESLHGQDTYYKVYTPIVRQYMEAHGITDEKDLPDYFVTAPEIDPHERVLMQAAWQKYIDASISSTVNLPEETTVEQIEDIYMDAWKNGLKGITVYRANCARTGILTKDGGQKKEETATAEEVTAARIERGMIEDVPDGLTYRKYKLTTGCGSLYLFVGIDDDENKIYDVFTSVGHNGCIINTHAISRLISTCIRGGISVDYVIDQLNRAGVCPSWQLAKGKGKPLSEGRSCASAVAAVLRRIQNELREYAVEEGDAEPEQPAPKPDIGEEKADIEQMDICPECGGRSLVHEGGCVSCVSCGYSKCG